MAGGERGSLAERLDLLDGVSQEGGTGMGAIERNLPSSHIKRCFSCSRDAGCFSNPTASTWDAKVSRWKLSMCAIVSLSLGVLR